MSCVTQACFKGVFCRCPFQKFHRKCSGRTSCFVSLILFFWLPRWKILSQNGRPVQIQVSQIRVSHLRFFLPHVAVLALVRAHRESANKFLPTLPSISPLRVSPFHFWFLSGPLLNICFASPWWTSSKVRQFHGVNVARFLAFHTTWTETHLFLFSSPRQERTMVRFACCANPEPASRVQNQTPPQQSTSASQLQQIARCKHQKLLDTAQGQETKYDEKRGPNLFETSEPARRRGQTGSSPFWNRLTMAFLPWPRSPPCKFLCVLEHRRKSVIKNRETLIHFWNVFQPRAHTSILPYFDTWSRRWCNNLGAFDSAMQKDQWKMLRCLDFESWKHIGVQSF